MTNASVQNWKQWGYERENVLKDLGGSGREEGGGVREEIIRNTKMRLTTKSLSVS